MEIDDKYMDIFDKEMNNVNEKDGVKKLHNAISEVSKAMILDSPLWMRLNFILNKIGDVEDYQINWDEVNKWLTENLKSYDYNIIDCVKSKNELLTLRLNCISADIGLGAWQKGICKDCGAEFYMDKKEVLFYTKKLLPLPKRCKDCREKKKLSFENKVDKTNMQVAMEKAGFHKNKINKKEKNNEQ